MIKAHKIRLHLFYHINRSRWYIVSWYAIRYPGKMEGMFAIP